VAAEATLKLLLLGEDRSASKALKDVGDGADRSSSKLQKAGSIAGKLLAGGLVLAAGAAVKFTQAAAEDAAQASKLANTLRNAAGASKEQIAATEKWIAAQGRAKAVADDELRPAMGKLVAATGDVAKAQDLASLAMDVSAGSGKSLDAVTMALVRAQNGSVGGLSRLGIATKDAAGKTRSLDEITKDLARTYKGAATEAAGTAEGKQKKLKIAFGELQEELGAKLLPAMTKLAEAGLKMVDWVDKNQTAGGVLAGAIAGLVTAVWAINAAAKAYTAVQTALNIVMSMNPIGLIVIGIAALVAAFVVAYQKSENFRDVIKGAMQAIGDTWRWVWNNVLAPVFELLAKAIGKQLEIWGRMLQAIGKVPGFGWVGDLGDKLVSAGQKAQQLDLRMREVNRSKARPSVDTSSIDNATYKVNNLRQLMRGLNTGVGNIGAPPKNKGIGGLMNPSRRAVGGRVSANQWAVVGERGAELVQFGAAGRVVSHQDSASLVAARDGGGEATATVNLVLDGRTLQTALLRLKRTNGGLELGIA